VKLNTSPRHGGVSGGLARAAAIGNHGDSGVDATDHDGQRVSDFLE
jgi:hypothetical protein